MPMHFVNSQNRWLQNISIVIAEHMYVKIKIDEYLKTLTETFFLRAGWPFKGGGNYQ